MSTSESYVDDPTVLDVDPLWRRIPPSHFVFDSNNGAFRPSSAAFDDHPNGSPMSVVLGKEVIAVSRLPESVLEGHQGFALAEISAGLARSVGQGIVRKPEDYEPAHAEVFGRKTDSIRRKLAKGSLWVIRPDQSRES